MAIGHIQFIKETLSHMKPVSVQTDAMNLTVRGSQHILHK
jgi:hypothetical protein